MLLTIVNLKHSASLRPGTSTCVHHNIENCQICSTTKGTDCLFVRYYEELTNDGVQAEADDHKQNCFSANIG